MQQAVVTTPKATLYQSVILRLVTDHHRMPRRLPQGYHALRLQRMAEDKRCT